MPICRRFADQATSRTRPTAQGCARVSSSAAASRGGSSGASDAASLGERMTTPKFIPLLILEAPPGADGDRLIRLHVPMLPTLVADSHVQTARLFRSFQLAIAIVHDRELARTSSCARDRRCTAAIQIRSLAHPPSCRSHLVLRACARSSTRPRARQPTLRSPEPARPVCVSSEARRTWRRCRRARSCASTRLRCDSSCVQMQRTVRRWQEHAAESAVQGASGRVWLLGLACAPDGRDRLADAVADTTRKPRAGEEDGVAYHFTTRDDFLRMVDEARRQALGAG